MDFKIKFYAVAAICVYSFNAYAITKLSFNDCISEILKNNTDIKTALEGIESAKNLKYASYGAFLPQLALFSNYSSSQTYTHVLSNIIEKTNSNYAGGISLSQSLFAGFSDFNKNQKTQLTVQLTINNYIKTLTNVSNTLKIAFAKVIFAKDSIKSAQEILKSREYNYKMVELRYQSGNENKGSLLLAKAYLEEANYNISLYKHDLEQATAELVRILGRDYEDQIEFSGIIPRDTVEENVDLKKIVLNSISYKNATIDETLSILDTKIYKANFLPSIKLTAQYQKSDTKFLPENSQKSIGIDLTFPIFTGGRDYFTTKSLYNQENTKTLAKENVLYDSINKIKIAYDNYIDAKNKSKVSKTFYEAIVVREKIAKEKYNNGLISFDDWDIIENDLIQKTNNYLQTQRDEIIAEANWELAKDEGVFKYE